MSHDLAGWVNDQVGLQWVPNTLPVLLPRREEQHAQACGGHVQGCPVELVIAEFRPHSCAHTYGPDPTTM